MVNINVRRLTPRGFGRLSLLVTIGLAQLVVLAADELSSVHTENQGQQEAGNITSNEPDLTLTELQRQELVLLARILDEAMSDPQVAFRRGLDWDQDMLKGPQGTVYVPYTLRIDPDVLGSESIVAGIRVVERGETVSGPATPPQTQSNALEQDSTQGQSTASTAGLGMESSVTEPRTYAFEDFHFVTLSDMQMQDGAYQFSRALQVPDGQYDVYVALKDLQLVDTPDELMQNLSTEVRQAVFKFAVNIPDLSNDLSTSSVFVYERTERISTALTFAQQRVDPYAIGAMRFVVRNSENFSTADELKFGFFIYNMQTDTNGKPDVTVEYNFHRQGEAGEEFFIASSPQEFNNETLQSQWDVAAGHQLLVGQDVPLSVFPVGSYRMGITVTDNASGNLLTRDIHFTVGEQVES
jgi:hypothetical protein